jgi:hypothetical protein
MVVFRLFRRRRLLRRSSIGTGCPDLIAAN